jgi:hypothetical protein
VAGDDERVDERLIPGGEAVVERAGSDRECVSPDTSPVSDNVSARRLPVSFDESRKRARLRARARMIASSYSYLANLGSVVHGSTERMHCPQSRLGSRDADGFRAAELEHPVQDVDGDGHLDRPTVVRARPRRVADHPLVARHSWLGQSTTIVAGGLLPPHAALLGDELQVPVAPGGGGRGRLARHRVPARRHDDRRLGVAFGDRPVHVLSVVGAVAGERGDRSLDLIEQRADSRAVIDIARG